MSAPGFAVAAIGLCVSMHAASASSLKLATWNLDWLTIRDTSAADFPTDIPHRGPEDFARLRAYAAHLNADVVALEEVDGPAAASRILDPAAYTFLRINEDIPQAVMLAVRRGVTVSQNPDLTALDVSDRGPHRLRYGLDATLHFAGGGAMRVLAIHLKNGCHFGALGSRRPQCALLARQLPPLRAWAQARDAEGVAFAILGDFNRTMDDPEPISQALLSDAHMLRATQGQADPCWQSGHFIDHIFLGGAAKSWLTPGSLRVMTYQGASPASRAGLSDHCPVSVLLTPK